MAYWVDEGFHAWPEVFRVGTAASGLYLRCGSWIAANLTDGFVPAEVAALYGSREWARKLVDVGLWENVEEGYRDTRYFPLNPTAEKANERRRRAAERQRRYRERNSRVPNTSRDASRDGAPSLPPKGGKGARRAQRDAPTLAPVHAFDSDGEGSCTVCGLPAANRCHTAA